MVFDLLYRHRRDLTGRPLRDRRAHLEDVVAGSELVFPVRRLAPDGLEAWKQVVERAYEGCVAKVTTGRGGRAGRRCDGDGGSGGQ
jgi:ATP-dependent DNA ligase